MNYWFMHLVKLGRADVKEVDLIIVTKAVVEKISCFWKMEDGMIAEDVESP